MKKSAKKALKENFRLATAAMRTLPDFIIVGAAKTGTTSLYWYLSQHPQVVPAVKKEIHFFDIEFHRGIRWYRSNFPTTIGLKFRNAVKGVRHISGEGSPYYMFHPHAPRRMAEAVPDVRLIVLLRDPAARAYSHYNHTVKYGFETLPFVEAIKKEKERLAGELEKMMADENYRSPKYRRYSYVSRGYYVNQLKELGRFFARKQILIIKSEDLFRQTQETYDRIVEFLELEPWTLKRTPNKLKGSYVRGPFPLEEELRAHFQPYNKQLSDYVGADFGW
jgi:hypothetical protein